MFVVSGEPGSKPFPGFVSSNSDLGSALHLPKPVMATATTSQLTAVEKPAKISPVKRTRLRSRDSRKIVLKRRKVKRLRARPKPDPDGVGLAPEAQRGGALAELALATLSQEEISAEANRDRKNDLTRDIQIMKIPRNRNRENTLAFPSRVKVALKKENPKKDRLDSRPAGSNTKSERLTINAIRKNIFDPRKRLKGIKKGFRDRLRSPESEESTTIPTILPQELIVSPFPNFPMIGSHVETIIKEKPKEVRDGRAETEVEVPNIGFEELTLTPGKQEIDLSSETFIPILRPETKSNQIFPAVHAVPDNKQTLPLHSQPVSPVKGQPLPISQFLDYGDVQEPAEVVTPRPVLPTNVGTNFDNLNTIENIPSVPRSPPFPDIFNSPRPQHPDFPPRPPVTTPFTTTPQPIFQDPPVVPARVVEQPKSQFPSLPPVESQSDAGKMTRHSETVVGNSVLGQISYVDIDGSVKQLSYKKPAPPPPTPAPPAPPLAPTFPSTVLHQQPLLPAFLNPVRPPPPSHLLPEVPQPREPPLNIRHHGSTVVPRLRPSPAPVIPAQPSTRPHLVSPVTSQPLIPTAFIHHEINHSDKPPARLPPGVRQTFKPSAHPDFQAPPRPGKVVPLQQQPRHFPTSRPVVLPTFTPAPQFSPGRFQPHPPLLPAVPPPFRPQHSAVHQLPLLTSTLPPPFRPHPAHKPHPLTSTLPPPFRPPHSVVHKLPSLTFFPPQVSPSPRPPVRPQLVSTIRPTAVTTSSAALPASPTPASYRVIEHYPSPSPIPAIWQPRGALFTPKPFVHLHTTVVPIVVRSSPPPPHLYSTRQPVAKSDLKSGQRFTTPHPHFFTTPYPQTPYPPLKYSPTPRPAPFYLSQHVPYNGHGVPAHLPVAARSDVNIENDLLTGASEVDDNIAPADGEQSKDSGDAIRKRDVSTDGSERSSQDKTSKRYTTSRNYRLGFDQT